MLKITTSNNWMTSKSMIVVDANGGEDLNDLLENIIVNAPEVIDFDIITDDMELYPDDLIIYINGGEKRALISHINIEEVEISEIENIEIEELKIIPFYSVWDEKLYNDTEKSLIIALSDEGEEIENLEEISNYMEYGQMYETSASEFILLTDEEADEVAKNYILNTLWAFNIDFIENYSNVVNDTNKEYFQKMQGELCENANEIILSIIDDIDIFIADAIQTDGRGHFIATYDGDEREIWINNSLCYYYMLG